MSHGESCDAEDLQDAGPYDSDTCRRIPTGDDGPELYAKLGCDEGGNATGWVCVDADCRVCQAVEATHGQCFADEFFGAPTHVRIDCLGVSRGGACWGWARACA